MGHQARLHGGLEAVGHAVAALAAGVFGAVVGLEADLVERDAAGDEVGHDALGEDAGQSGAALL
ncbi:MAG TPA: fused response regulator/thioredoxin-disulfide reductase, partial [Armatimonadota bacterium]|nr:fused response regulator/thioredoxin-disulfide reductase [Armatimonadota bacterium]